MDLDNAVLWVALSSKSSQLEVRAAGIDQAVLTKEAGRVWRFILEYTTTYGDVPPLEVVADNTGVEVVPSSDNVSIDYLADKLFERYDFNAIQRGSLDVARWLEEGNVSEARNTFLGVSDIIGESAARRLGVHTLGDYAGDVRANYLSAERGETGVLFPWEALNLWTRGMFPKTLTFFVARPSMGKTFAIVITLLQAWLDGKKVLIVSPEMGASELAERIIAIKAKIPYGALISGSLSSMTRDVLNQEVDDLSAVGSAASGFLILDDEDRLKPDEINRIVEMERPDIVGVDSAYMLKLTDYGRSNEKFAATVDWMRRSCRRPPYSPWIGVSQLSRDFSKLDAESINRLKEGRGTGGAEGTAARSDELLWNVHNLFLLHRDEELRERNQAMIAALKIRRRAEAGMTCFVNWDFETMNFEEVTVATSPIY